MVTMVVHFEDAVTIRASDQFIRYESMLVIIIIIWVGRLIVQLFRIARHLHRRIIIIINCVCIASVVSPDGFLNHRLGQRVFNHLSTKFKVLIPKKQSLREDQYKKIRLMVPSIFFSCRQIIFSKTSIQVYFSPQVKSNYIIRLDLSLNHGVVEFFAEPLFFCFVFKIFQEVAELSQFHCRLRGLNFPESKAQKLASMQTASLIPYQTYCNHFLQELYILFKRQPLFSKIVQVAEMGVDHSKHDQRVYAKIKAISFGQMIKKFNSFAQVHLFMISLLCDQVAFVYFLQFLPYDLFTLKYEELFTSGRLEVNLLRYQLHALCSWAAKVSLFAIDYVLKEVRVFNKFCISFYCAEDGYLLDPNQSFPQIYILCCDISLVGIFTRSAG